MTGETWTMAEAIEKSLAPLHKAFSLAELPADRLKVVAEALRTTLSIMRSVPGTPEVFEPLDELLFAVEKLVSKPEETIEGFLQRDTKKPGLTPAVELRAHLVLAYDILRSVTPRIPEGTAAKEAGNLYAAFGRRGPSTIRGWHANIEYDEAADLYHQIRAVAQRLGYYGLDYEAARRTLRQLASEAAQHLGTNA